MNPFLIVLILIGAIALWFLSYFLYKPIGKMVKRIIDGSINAIKEEDKK